MKRLENPRPLPSSWAHLCWSCGETWSYRAPRLQLGQNFLSIQPLGPWAKFTGVGSEQEFDSLLCEMLTTEFAQHVAVVECLLPRRATSLSWCAQNYPCFHTKSPVSNWTLQGVCLHPMTPGHCPPSSAAGLPHYWWVLLPVGHGLLKKKTKKLISSSCFGGNQGDIEPLGRKVWRSQGRAPCLGCWCGCVPEAWPSSRPCL